MSLRKNMSPRRWLGIWVTKKGYCLNAKPTWGLTPTPPGIFMTLYYMATWFVSRVFWCVRFDLTCTLVTLHAAIIYHNINSINVNIMIHSGMDMRAKYRSPYPHIPTSEESNTCSIQRSIFRRTAAVGMLRNRTLNALSMDTLSYRTDNWINPGILPLISVSISEFRHTNKHIEIIYWNNICDNERYS